jgi:LacI family transcriptional regulator
MINRGNKKIVFVGTEHKYALNEMKQKGYVRAMQEKGLPVDIIYSSGDINKNELFFHEELDKRIPDVALVVRDSMAISFMNVATKRGIKVPEQFQVIGMQNTRYAILSNPKLTCAEVPIYEMGNRAMSYLTELMRNEESKGQKILLPYNVVWRESTK